MFFGGIAQTWNKWIKNQKMQTFSHSGKRDVEGDNSMKFHPIHYIPSFGLDDTRICTHTNALLLYSDPMTYPEPKIIGLCGPKGVGKSTYAKSFEGAAILSFATPIKEMLKDNPTASRMAGKNGRTDSKDA